MAANFNVLQLTMEKSTGRGLNAILEALGMEGAVQMVKLQNKYIYKIRILDDNADDDELNLQKYMKELYASAFRKKMLNIQIFNSSEINGSWNNGEVLRRN